ncbi:MAG: RsmB/NOP family class I SAM-dependent RNA methyltransferase [Pseudomonadota bacterium]
MTPGARLSAAIEVLDHILAGTPAEKALTNWARGARYAGSGDRAAVRDHVFDALRCRRSFAWRGGAETGRGLVIGLCRAQELDIAALFTGEGHAPNALSDDETKARDIADAPRAVRFDMPDWLLPDVERSLGAAAPDIMTALQGRAPIFLRVNLAKCAVSDAIAALVAEGIGAEPHTSVAGALRVTENPRRVKSSQAYRDGLVELQDAASQAVVQALPPAVRVLDFCAGGGGKALGLAAHGATVFAHDADAGRMRDLPQRAARAGAAITCLDRNEVDRHAPYDLVLCDVPCSGSGAWRRSPEGKWALSSERLEELQRTQAKILTDVAPLVARDGALAYVTCSFLAAENDDQATVFCDSSDWTWTQTERFLPGIDGDGFYLAVFSRP